MDDLDAACERIHDTIQACITDGLLTDGMMVDWYLTGTMIDTDGDTCSIMLSSPDADLPTSLALLETARLVVGQDIIDWHRG